MTIEIPKDEHKNIYYDNNSCHFKHIADRIKIYSYLSVADVIIEKGSNSKYVVTYIHPDYKTIYGRKICKNGKLGKHLLHITGSYSTFSIDKAMIDSILMGADYDPTAAIIDVAKEKQRIYRQRVKQRLVAPKDCADISAWYRQYIKPGAVIYMTYVGDEYDVDDCKYTVCEVDSHKFVLKRVKAYHSRVNFTQIGHSKHIYLEQPVYYKDIND